MRHLKKKNNRKKTFLGTCVMYIELRCVKIVKQWCVFA